MSSVAHLQTWLPRDFGRLITIAEPPKVDVKSVEGSLLRDDDVWSKSKQRRRWRSGDGRQPPSKIYASAPIEKRPIQTYQLGLAFDTRTSQDFVKTQTSNRPIFYLFKACLEVVRPINHYSPKQRNRIAQNDSCGHRVGFQVLHLHGVSSYPRHRPRMVQHYSGAGRGATSRCRRRAPGAGRIGRAWSRPEPLADADANPARR
jgi:hypothetical protein